jgi:phosphodiesterase/alkaline phosphatase D-like protein
VEKVKKIVNLCAKFVLGVDLMLHLGDQVYCNKEFDNGWTLLRRYQQEGKLEQANIENIKNSLREIYRFTWGLPYTKEIYANVPHLMIWSDNGFFYFCFKIDGL